MKNSVVICAAGKGSRFVGLPNEYSKCALHIPLKNNNNSVYITPITATMNAFLSRGINDFHIVLGYCKESVMEEVSKLVDKYVQNYGKDAITAKFIDNTKFDSLDKGYSVSLGLKSAIDDGADTIYLVDGDTLLAPEVIARIIDVPNRNALIVRSTSGDPLNSVRAYGSPFGVIDFWSNNSDDKESDHHTEDVEVFTSGNVYKIIIDKNRTDKNVVSDIVNNYITKSDEGIPTVDHEGLGILRSIATISEPFFPVYSLEGIYDINTKDDFEAFKKTVLSVAR